jgi:transposase InsO family protein
MPNLRFQHMRLLKGWKNRVRSAVWHVISLARYSLLTAHAQRSGIGRNGDLERLEQEVLQLQEELRIKDVRMAHVPAARRPHYPPVERMAILELRAGRGWSIAQTAKAFLVTEETISNWMRRVDEDGPNALVAPREPVNKFPDFVHYLVRRLRVLCPTMGKVKIAQTLARAGLHLGATTVGRMLQETAPPPVRAQPTESAPPRTVIAKHANHVWGIDLTTVPTASGFWVTWLPAALPQRWPFCWWLLVVVDHFSRRVIGLTAFSKMPTGKAVREFLDRLIRRTKACPQHLICDKGRQFWCLGFKCWCRRQAIALRFGAVGRHGSIAVVERFIRTFKEHCSQGTLLPLGQHRFTSRLRAFGDWFNEYRPHTALRGQTPNEVYERSFPAVRRPRHEPRREWPRGSPCAKPWALARHNPGGPLELIVELHAGQKHLPVFMLKRAA